MDFDESALNFDFDIEPENKSNIDSTGMTLDLAAIDGALVCKNY